MTSTDSERSEGDPASERVEPLTHPHLTLLDHGQPRRIDQKYYSRRVTLNLKEDLNEFRCSVCMGWMKNTSVVMGCLHRFCAACLEESLRKNKKQCPKCRIHIPTRRSLRADARFDSLICCILGDLKELETREDREMEKELQGKQIANSGMGRMRKRKHGELNGSDRDLSDRYDTTRVWKSSFYSPNKVNVSLIRHPNELQLDRLAKPELLVTGSATVGWLKTFLSRKLSHSPPNDFQIAIWTRRKDDVALDDAVPLSELSIKTINVSAIQNIFLLYRLAAHK